MRQAITILPKRIELQHADPYPAPGPSEALLDIASVGICGSDYELWLGSDPYSRFPIRQGHEFSARIKALPDSYVGDFRVGELVAVEPLLPDGTCFACKRGHPNCCSSLRVIGAHVDGAFVDQLLVPLSNLYAVGQLTADLAAFVEPVSIGLQMVTRSGLGPGDQIVIFGAGPIGQAVQIVASDRGARVATVDILPERLKLAKANGAEKVVDASESDPTEELGLWTSGDGPAVAFEATGVARVLQQAIDVVAHSGTVVIAGTSNDPVEVPTMSLVKKELNILGSRNNAGLYADAVSMVQRHRDRCEALITHRYPLDRVQEAMEFGAANTRDVGKVIIRVSD
jgi:threonine dehydrogenase-like Zn-dependent dehydrogenase